MTAQENKPLVRRCYEQVAGTGDVADLARYIWPDYTEFHQSRAHRVGIVGARDHVLGVRRAIPICAWGQSEGKRPRRQGASLITAFPYY